MQAFPKKRAPRRPFLNLPRLWKKPTPRLVLVIGGGGYIGSALVPKLLARGHRVRVLDRLFYGLEPIRDVINHPNLEITKADFRRVDKLVECMQGVDAVIHLGAIVGDPACALDRDLTIEVNLMATRTIAEVAKGYGIRRFIFASTCSVYGASTENQLLIEDGLSGRTRFDLVVNLLTAKAVVDGEITIQGGDQWRPFLHVG